MLARRTRVSMSIMFGEENDDVQFSFGSARVTGLLCTPSRFLLINHRINTNDFITILSLNNFLVFCP